MHRIEDAAHSVFTKIDEGPHFEAMRQTTLEDERQVKSDNVVPHDLVGIGIEPAHKIQKRGQRLLLVLFVSTLIDAEYNLALTELHAFEFLTGNRPYMHCDAKHPARGCAQRAQLITTIFFSRDIFEITLLLL